MNIYENLFEKYNTLLPQKTKRQRGLQQRPRAAPHRSGKMISSADIKYGTTTLIPFRSEQNRAEEFKIMLARTGLQMKSEI